MSQKTYYHNITKGKFNLDIEQLQEIYHPDDDIKFTTAGSAIVMTVDKLFTNKEIENYKLSLKNEE